ncbi:MAG: D-alanyl-D-alanine carboxypeptidase [Lachnospiraceae bacterium]|nr:D-alanyl-D-alanine carboxypeptidase [Lachnospiraceae bacterium]
MKKFLKIILPSIIAFILILSWAVPVFADETNGPIWPSAPEVDTRSVFVTGIDNDLIFLEKEADTQRYPASTTKILTCLLALENCSLDETVVFSERALDLEEAATTINSEVGEEMSMKDCLYGLMLASGNDCAMAIAEHVGGSIEGFADMMNAKAAELGCTNSHFVNPSGLFDEDHYTTARDMALIAKAAFKNSTFIDLISTFTYSMGPTNKHDKRKFSNWNLCIDPDSDAFSPDVIGGKTGFLDEAGRCLVTYAEKNNMPIVIVQFWGDYTGIFTEAKNLVNFIYNYFGMQNISLDESRFSYVSPQAKLSLDPSGRILTLNNMSLETYDSNIRFAEDMSEEEKATALNGSEKELFAVIDYSYADHELGSINVYKDDRLTTRKASFINVYTISPLYVIIFVLIVIILLVIFSTSKKKKRRAPATAQKRK